VIPDIRWLLLTLGDVVRGLEFFIADLLDSKVFTIDRRSKSRTKFRRTPEMGLAEGCQGRPNRP
jgi:hypothetical protein